MGDSWKQVVKNLSEKTKWNFLSTNFSVAHNMGPWCDIKMNQKKINPICWELRWFILCIKCWVPQEIKCWEGDGVENDFQPGDLCRGGGISAGPGRTGRIWTCETREDVLKGNGQAQMKTWKLWRMDRDSKWFHLPWAGETRRHQYLKYSLPLVFLELLFPLKDLVRS